MDFSQIRISQKHWNLFKRENTQNLEGSNLDNQQKEKVKELFMSHQQVFYRNSNDLG